MTLKFVKENNIITIKLMNEEHTIMLLKRKLRTLRDTNRNEIIELTTTLKFMSFIIV